MIVPKPRSITLNAGNSAYIDCQARNWQQPVSVIVKPTSSATVESTNELDTGTATWIDSGSGAMTVNTEIVRYAPCTYLKVTAIGGNATFHVMV